MQGLSWHIGLPTRQTTNPLSVCLSVAMRSEEFEDEFNMQDPESVRAEQRLPCGAAAAGSPRMQSDVPPLLTRRCSASNAAGW